jgi:hypothetical protein
MSKTLSGTSPEQARNLDVAKGAPSLGEQNMNKNEQMIREQAYELWDHAGRPEGRRNSGSLREPNSNAGRRHERETSARMFPRMEAVSS